MGRVVRVAAGVLVDDDQRVLLCQRASNAHLGGAWEFPGGKCEPGESFRETLERELLEEIGIRVRSASPLLRVSHDYAEKTVELDFWQVMDYYGHPRPLEGQPMEWVATSALREWNLPEADQPVVELLERRASFK